MYRSAVAGVLDLRFIAEKITYDAADIADVEYFICAISIRANALFCKAAAVEFSRSGRSYVAAVVDARVDGAVPA